MPRTAPCTPSAEIAGVCARVRARYDPFAPLRGERPKALISPWHCAESPRSRPAQPSRAGPPSVSGGPVDPAGRPVAEDALVLQQPLGVDAAEVLGSERVRGVVLDRLFHEPPLRRAYLGLFRLAPSGGFLEQLCDP